jgi:hypothetical protein
LVAEVRRRTPNASVPVALDGLEVVAFTRAKVTPMVRGLFPRREQDSVLEVLSRSVVFLSPANIDQVLLETHWTSTAWDLANPYLASCEAPLLGEDALHIIGLSEETTCYVSSQYVEGGDGRFADVIVHEAAHVFHNCKRRAPGLDETRRREWPLELEFTKRETFAYACETYSRILELGGTPASRRDLLAELEQGHMPADERVDGGEYLAILREAVAARNGWEAHPRAVCTGARGEVRSAVLKLQLSLEAGLRGQLVEALDSVIRGEAGTSWNLVVRSALVYETKARGSWWWCFALTDAGGAKRVLLLPTNEQHAAAAAELVRKAIRGELETLICARCGKRAASEAWSEQGATGLPASFAYSLCAGCGRTGDPKAPAVPPSPGRTPMRSKRLRPAARQRATPPFPDLHFRNAGERGAS